MRDLLRVVLTAACVLVLGGILVAGLWPFHAPRNEVRWLSGQNGLQFGEHGSIVSANPFKASQSDEDSPCSLEIWLQPVSVGYSGTILAFYQPESLTAPFRLRQSLGDLTIHRTWVDQVGHKETRKIYADDVFSHQKSALVSITSGPGGTTVYEDGAVVGKFATFRFSMRDLTGQFILGNTPSTTDSWRGQVKGLAIYGRELTAAQVAQHHASWAQGRRNDLAQDDGIVARYLFNERQGEVVHNQVDAATNLVIPEKFFVLRARFLEPFWEEFYGTWSYWENVGINIAGFIPLGFFFCAYLSLILRMERAAAITVVAGLLVSLTIEVSQAFLPSRDSGTTDLITNTLGTLIGAMAYRHRLVQTVANRLMLSAS